MARDDFTENTRRVLAERVGYRCSNPDCRAPTIAPHTQSTKSIRLGVAASITAKSEAGPRYDTSLTSEQRRSIENGIWLCLNCAKLIDSDAERYTVQLLHEWKNQAERAALSEAAKVSSVSEPPGDLPRSSRIVRVFVSSPTDADQERTALQEIVDEINQTEGKSQGVILELDKWEANVTPRVAPMSQQPVDDSQMAGCDIYLGIMSSQFGSMTEGYGSGTEEETRDALRLWSEVGAPWITFYFNGAPQMLESGPSIEESSKVQKLREQLVGERIAVDYFGVRGREDAFYEKVNRHLRSILELVSHPSLRESKEQASPPQQDDNVTGEKADRVPTLTDEPARVDRLHRRAFARWLAIRLKQIRQDSLEPQSGDSFLLHLHGPWGSGKSTLLNFLEAELLGKRDANDMVWIVIRFNAWQQQKAGPPWWSLMSAVLRQGTEQTLRSGDPRWTWSWVWHLLWYGPIRWAYLWGRHLLWRASFRWWQYILAMILLAFGGSLIFPYLWAGDAKDNVELVSGLIAVAGAFFAATMAATRTLLPGSARAAQTFTEATSDPMRWIALHFSAMIRWLGRPVAVFVDDLDRCQEGFVVEVLEGIQTLYRPARVVWVVAADRRWLCTSFETVYDKFNKAVEEPGQRLGYLFLEKVFQLSASMPRVPEGIQKRYWGELLYGGKELEDTDSTDNQAREDLKNVTTDAEILEKASKRTGSSSEDLAYRRAAAERLADTEVQRGTEHRLLPFAPLLDPNPRSMKRLVNAYGIQLAVVALAGARVDLGVLTLWTIVSLRWPVLAEELEKHPDRLRLVGETDDAKLQEIPGGLRPLFKEKPLLDVVQGSSPGVNARLTVQALKDVLSLRSGETSQPLVA